MKDQIEWLAPEDVEPPHEVKDDGKLSELVASMRAAEEGWIGRPLVVWRALGQVFALTGSHRIAAAREVMNTIPCVVLTDEQVAAAKVAVNVDQDWVASNLQFAGYDELASLVAQG